MVLLLPVRRAQHDNASSHDVHNTRVRSLSHFLPSFLSFSFLTPIALFLFPTLFPVAGAMGDIIEHVEDTDLEPLQRAAHLCAAAGLAGFEVVVRALHAACVAAAAAGRELAVVAFEAAQNVPWAEMSAACASALGDAAAAATEAAKTGGALLLVAMKESGEFSEEAAAAAAEMAKTGALATGAAATEIAQKMAPILAKLSDAACEVIQRSFARC